MSEVTQTPRQSAIMKLLAVAGLLGILGVTGYLAVLAVQFAPAGFTALANLASRVQSGASPAQFTTISEPRTVATGEQTKISWNESNRPGSYLFSYVCAEGVAVSAVQADGIRGLSCDTEYNLGSVTNLTLEATSEKEAYADVFYTIGYVRSQTAETQAVAQGSFLVVNETLLQDSNQGIPEPEPTPTLPSTPEPSVPPVTPMPSEPEPAPTTPEPSTPIITPTPTTAPEPTYIYTIPVSDPQGTPDIAVRFLNVGSVTNNRFVIGSLERNEAGAVQFEVRNLGTKTSAQWTYTIEAPGLSVTSAAQAPLKPSERAVIAVEFPGTRDPSETITVRINTTPDRTQTNNQFTQRVTQN
jgi:hypothetical protein